MVLKAIYFLSAFLFLANPISEDSAVPEKAAVADIAQSLNHEELGIVNWHRSLDKAKAISNISGKSILLLFQEVPGCVTCRNYGKDVLSHPLLVEAIESLFVPLAIFNNKGGADKETLQYFKEPSWNNPVVRIVNKDLKNVTARLNGNYSKAGLAQTMIEALLEEGKAVPQYLRLLADSFAAEQNLKQATYSMYCFWTGEAALGRLNGVVKTRAGFAHGKEVVVVWYDPNKITEKDLSKIASQASCKKESNTTAFRDDREPKYYLSHSPYKYVPMTAIQASKANAMIGDKLDPSSLFSPKQLAIYKKVKGGKKTGLTIQIDKDDLSILRSNP